MTEDEITHRKVHNTLERLEKQKIAVIIGFTVFWALWIVAAAITAMNLWIHYVG